MVSTPLPPKAGLPLGLRLGLFSAGIVLVLLGSLTYLREEREIHQGWRNRVQQLGDLAAPLAQILPTVDSQDELELLVSDFHQAFQERERTEHEIIIRSERGQVIAAAPLPLRLPPIGQAAWARVTVNPDNNIFAASEIIIVNHDTHYANQVNRRWYGWALEMLLIALSILISIAIGQYFLIARPLGQLLRRLKQMEEGYWSRDIQLSGAWEMQWIADHFNRLRRNLEKTISGLVNAERRSRMDSAALLQAIPSPNPPPIPLVTPKDPLEAAQKQLLHQYLLDKSKLLENADPDSILSQRMAREAWEQDFVDAERLGDHYLKARLEDAAFALLFPHDYQRLSEEMDKLYQANEAWREKQLLALKDALDNEGLSHHTIESRVKHLGGIWRKMQTKDLELDQVYDIFGFRIILQDVKSCYRALKVIHSLFEPTVLRFKDYIAKPKENGYQSIHTSLRDESGKAFEIQIRTRSMHQVADLGQAAHWSYKENSARISSQKPRRSALRSLRAKLSFGRNHSALDREQQ